MIGKDQRLKEMGDHVDQRGRGIGRKGESERRKKMEEKCKGEKYIVVISSHGLTGICTSL